MDSLQVWKLATDILLVLSLVYLCFRFAKSPRSAASARQLQALDNALRELVRDAEMAGKTLNDQLLKRQRSLEQLVFDAGTVEHRLNRSIEDANARREELRSTLSLANTYQGTTQTVQAADPAQPAPARVPEPPSFSDIELSQHEERDTEPQASWPQVNIYGEPIETAPQTRVREEQAASYKPLSNSIERKVEKKPAANSLEDIYAAAEELLRAGKDLEGVATATNLPLEDVRLLSHMIAQESTQATEVDVEEDPRLGVLGSMRRQTQVL